MVFMVKKVGEVVLVCDALRDPRDLAQMVHLSLATNTKLFLTGSSLFPLHPKVIGILDSWIPGFKQKPNLKKVVVFEGLEECVAFLRKKGFEVLGTSPSVGKNFFSTNLGKGKTAIVFGTETSGLSDAKMKLMGGMLRIPMQGGTRFYTLSAIAPVFAYEALRQKKLV